MSPDAVLPVRPPPYAWPLKMMAMSQLECRVEQGILSHEMSIFVEGIGRRYESWASPRDIQLLEGGKGLVQVRVVGRDPEREALLVELPCEVLLGTRRVWVRKALVRPPRSIAS